MSGNNGIDQDLYDVMETAQKLAISLYSHHLTVEHLAIALLENGKIQKAIIDCGAHHGVIHQKLKGGMTAETMPSNKPITATPAFDRVMQRARQQAYSSGRNEMSIVHVMAAILNEDSSDSLAKYELEDAGITRGNFLKAFMANETGAPVEDIEIDPETGDVINKADKPLEAYCDHLNKMVEDGEIDRLIGRDKELKRVTQILSRRKKNNPILVGEPGVGKTAIAEGLAYRIVNGQVPEYIEDMQIYSLDMGALIAGTKFRGEFEDRLKGVVKEITKMNKEGKKTVLFIDEIHNIIGAGTGGGASSTMDASNLLKPALAKGDLHCFGSTTFNEFDKHFNKDAALKRRFQKVDIVEPTEAETIKILQGLRGYFEDFHEIKFTEAAITAAVSLSVKHIHDNQLPDKAIDILDEAGAAQRVEAPEDHVDVIDIPQIEAVVANIARVPDITVKQDDAHLLKDLAGTMKQYVYSQDNPIDALARAIKTSRAGLREPNKPVGSFLFAGPTGVGKTEVAKQLARIMGVHFERIDMSEYMEKHTVAKLIGSPPGYVGHDDNDGRLIDAVDRNPHMVLLLDEVEKAHPDVFNILLQVMDDAVLTSSRGKKVHFNNVVVIMTTNAGAGQLEKQSIGFGSGFNDSAQEEAIKKLFQPEFRNRLDDIMYFDRLSKETMAFIVEKFLNEMQLLLDDKNITVEVAKEASKWLAEKGYDPLMGARPLGRLIQREIKDHMADEILFGKLKNGGTVAIGVKDDEIDLTYRELPPAPVIEVTAEPETVEAVEVGDDTTE